MNLEFSPSLNSYSSGAPEYLCGNCSSIDFGDVYHAKGDICPFECARENCTGVAVARFDFCEDCIPMCEMCGGDIPYRMPGQNYANCGSDWCEAQYYQG